MRETVKNYFDIQYKNFSVKSQKVNKNIKVLYLTAIVKTLIKLTNLIEKFKSFKHQTKNLTVH